MIATAPFFLVCRFFHIVAGVLWVGSTFLFFVFVGPSADEVGPSAQPVLTAAVKKRKAVKVITGLGLMTVAPGLERLIDAGNAVTRSGDAPSADQQARIDQLRNGLKRHGAIDLVLLLLAVIAMATARYW